MKLVEFLREKFPTMESFPKNSWGEYHLDRNVLELLKDDLQKCDEFKNASLVFPQLPVVQDVDEQSIVVTMANYLLHDDTFFGGKCYLYSINLTPELYDPFTIYEAVKDGCTITPVMYDPTNFKPFKKIVIRQELDDDNGTYLNREDLHRKIDQMLDNQSEYQMLGNRGIMIRGYMSVTQSPAEPKKTLF